MIIFYFKLWHKKAHFFFLVPGTTFMDYAGPASCKLKLWSTSPLMRQIHNWRSKTQSLMASHRLPLVQDSFLLICKWNLFPAFALPFTFQRSFHNHDFVYGASDALSWASQKFCVAVIIIAIYSLQRDPGRAGVFPLTVQVSAQS